MLQTRHLTAILLSVSIAFALAACATMGGPQDSPELKQKKAYYAALKEFTLTLEKYNDYYAKADEATQAKWKADIDPWFKKANSALKAWKMAVDNPDMDADSQEALYLEIKSELLMLLVDVFGTKEG